MTDSRPTLTVIGGPHDGTTLRLDAPAEKTLGSGAGSHLKLELGNVAALHARLVWDARGLLLSDAGSDTGTYVNGERLTSARVLVDGDRIFLGPPGSKNTAKLLATGMPPPGRTDAILVNLETEKVFLHDPEVGGAAAARTAGATPAAAPPKPAAAAKPAGSTPAKAEYATEPSIAPADRVREELPVAPPEPPPVRKPAAPRRPAVQIPEWPRAVWIGLATALVVGGGLAVFLSTRQPPPVLTSVAPPRIEAGQPIMLAGVGFGATADKNAVHVGDVVAPIKAASETEITATVPDAVPAGEVQVRVEREGRGSNALFVKVFRVPRIDALEPDVALPGAEVVARGVNLGAGAAVVVGGQNAEVLDAQPSHVRFRVPADLPVVPGKGVIVSLRVGTDQAKPATLFLGRLPFVLEANPLRGEAGERVVLKGRGFDIDPRGNLVTFGDRPALVLRASATELTVVAPGAPGQAQSDLPVVVRAKGGTSTSALAFTLVRSSLGTYAPRYFPEPAAEHPGHDHAFVACELGPVLLLTGKAEAASTAERATKVAAALNALAERSDPVSFESRDRPTPGVGLAGHSELLVAATAEDAAGYGEPWGATGSVGAPTAERLAAYWAALLQDHRLLFFQKDRPVKVLELTPRGKVLSNLYAEAVRRSGPGQGVPTGVVSNLTPQAMRELRDLALQVPTDSGGVGAAARAVEGLWQGTMAEPGAPEKPLTVRLQIQGASLAGTLTTRVGKVAMDVPLQSVSYQRGVLKFTALTAGAPRQFNGTLQGNTLSGTFQATGGQAGRFTLKYLQ